MRSWHAARRTLACFPLTLPSPIALAPLGRGQQLSWVSSVLSTNGGPATVMFEHGVEYGEQLTHARGESELGSFAGRAEPLVEGDEDRVMTHGHDGTHVEDGPDLRAPAPDRAPAAQGSAVAVEGGDADERGNLPTTQRAEFGQGRHERGGQDGADAGGTAQQVVLLAPQRTGA